MAEISPAQPTDPAAIMRQLRLSVLTKSPGHMGAKASAEFPRIFAVVVDFPIGTNTATIVSSAAGDASLYTTATFGVIGGIGQEACRLASKELVASADALYDEAQPTTDFSYPDSTHVYFFLVTYNDGVREIKASQASIYTGNSPLSALFGKAQNVLTQLRLLQSKK